MTGSAIESGTRVRPIRVLVASAWDPTSGVLTVYRSLAEHLAAHDVRYSAFAFDGWREDTLWTFCDELIDGRTVTLAEVLMSGRFDVLHCVDTTYAPPYGVETWVRRARFRGPVVLMGQTTNRSLGSPVHASRFVACSDDVASVLALDADGPIEVITNGFDAAIFRPGQSDERSRPLLVWVGRSVDPAKDVRLFLDATALMPEFDAVLLDGHPDPIDQDVALRLDGRVSRRVQAKPHEVADVFRAAGASGGAFVSTSRYEGFPLAAAEAMACGCPVVAPRVPGYGHLDDGGNSVIFDRSGGPEAVVEAVRRTTEPSMRLRMIERAMSDAARWTSSEMAQGYLRVYREALESSDENGVRRGRDTLVRAAWRAALTARPAWHALRRRVLPGRRPQAPRADSR